MSSYINIPSSSNVSSGLAGITYVTAVAPSGGDDGALIKAACTTVSGGGGGVVFLNGTTFKARSEILLSGLANVTIAGRGPGATSVVADDAGGLAGGNIIRISNSPRCGIQDLTLDSLVARAAGAAIVTEGGSGTLANTALLNGTGIGNVCFNNQFNGVVIQDAAGSVGAWKVNLAGLLFQNTSHNGTGIVVNSPNGGSHYLRDVYFAGNPTVAQQPLAGLNIQSSGDICVDNMVTILAQYGCLINPGTGQIVTALQMSNCDWDTCSQYVFAAIPSGSGAMQAMTVASNWFASGTVGNVLIDATGTSSGGLSGDWRFVGCKSYNSPLGFRVKKGYSVDLVGCNTGGTATGFSFDLNSAHCKVADCRVVPSSQAPGGGTVTNGLVIEVGGDVLVSDCDLHNSTTPITGTPNAASAGNIT